MRSQQLVEVLQAVVRTDLLNPQSILGFYMTRNLSGGWEGWLQTVYARGVFALNSVSNFNREVLYPGTAQRCDLWFQGGTGIWVELKTQRTGVYAGTVGDFAADIYKIQALSTAFRQTNVNVALAVFQLTAADRTALNQIRTGGPSGTLTYWCFTTDQRWTDVTANILTAPLGRFMIAAFRAA